ncbi:IS3 family transposase [Enterocloster clostridioformis]|uniref:IS3 family transposase n=2 Tax=Enterocloster clostridioformis TaxID=1531 RepID=UPI001F029192|nr:IS3 family transposase [Enterocloster clostridioformis]
MHILKTEHSVKTLCRVLGVNRSTYYKHFNTSSSPRSTQNILLRSQILDIYSSSKKRLGAYKITKRLQVEFQHKVSVGQVYRLMNSMALPKMSTQKPRFQKPSPSSGDCINLLNKQFYPKEPNQIWVSDITYVKVSSRFCYICVVIDLFSRKVVSYKTSARINTQLVLDTVYFAYAKRGYPQKVMFHSDRGCQYTSKDFRKALDNAGCIQSFSAKGHPYDNAVAESFFKYLKKEELNRRIFSSLEDLNLSLFEYIEGFYNRRRPHSANGFLSPIEKEQAYFQQ